MSFLSSTMAAIASLKQYTVAVLEGPGGTAINQQGNANGAALVETANTSAGTNHAAIAVPQTTAAAMGTSATLTPRGIRLWSPDGTGGSTTNTDAVAVGYSGLTLANGDTWLLPGDEVVLPCANLSEVYSVSASASQTLRIRVL